MVSKMNIEAACVAREVHDNIFDASYQHEHDSPACIPDARDRMTFTNEMHEMDDQTTGGVVEAAAMRGALCVLHGSGATGSDPHVARTSIEDKPNAANEHGSFAMAGQTLCDFSSPPEPADKLKLEDPRS